MSIDHTLPKPLSQAPEERDVVHTMETSPYFAHSELGDSWFWLPVL